MIISGLCADTDYRVHRFSTRARVVLPDTDETRARLVHTRIGITHLAWRC